MAQSDPKERERFLSQAQFYLDNGLYREAEDFAETRLGDLPKDVDAQTVLCQVWMKTGRIHKVKAVLGEVEETISELSKFHLVMGDVCRKGGLTQEAIRFYRRFTALNPRSEQARKVSWKLRRMEPAPGESPSPDRGDAVDEMAEDAQISSDLYTLTLAELYIKQNHYDMAREVLDAILRKEPNNRKAADMIRELDRIRKERAERELALVRKKRVIGELTKWLQNLSRANGAAISSEIAKK
jgi:tetratricopeptide (TPR) repeat protein